MYKFANGLVCFTEEDKENFIRAGLKLVEDKKEEKDVKDDNNGVIKQRVEESNKATRRVSRRTR
ncbi:MAG: hypothetical protein J6T15_03750 [Bacilli bacterium]|nr:hypothetical protein [Bacilli bacterium]